MSEAWKTGQGHTHSRGTLFEVQTVATIISYFTLFTKTIFHLLPTATTYTHPRVLLSTHSTLKISLDPFKPGLQHLGGSLNHKLG